MTATASLKWTLLLAFAATGIGLGSAGAAHLSGAPPETVRPSAEAGRADAQRELGVRYATGQGGVERDHAAALEWTEKAAEGGDPWAIRNLGISTLKGDGVKQDPEKALEYFEQAAALGEDKAQYNLAVLLYEGKVTERDLKAAYQWYLRAANQGHPLAKRNVALMLAQGEGTEIDRVEAYKWFELAAREGQDKAAQERELTARDMPADEIAEAKERVDAWQPKSEWTP